MPSTTIHVPAALLEEVDARAKAAGVSRNRFILRALQRVLDEEKAWSAGFLDELRRRPPGGDRKALDETLKEARARRQSKGPPLL